MLPESRWKNNSKNHTSDTKCVESVELSANAAWQIPHFLFQKGVHKNSLIFMTPCDLDPLRPLFETKKQTQIFNYKELAH